MNKIDKILLKDAIKAYKNGDIPVAAVIVKNGKIVAHSYNNRQKRHIITGHAEVNVINKVTRKQRDWRLDGYELYVTMFPCSMCQEVIFNARIKKVYFYLINDKNSYQHQKIKFNKVSSEINNKLKFLLDQLFLKLRK